MINLLNSFGFLFLNAPRWHCPTHMRVDGIGPLVEDGFAHAKRHLRCQALTSQNIAPRWHNLVLREIAMYCECIRSLRRYLVSERISGFKEPFSTGKSLGKGFFAPRKTSPRGLENPSLGVFPSRRNNYLVLQTLVNK